MNLLGPVNATKLICRTFLIPPGMVMAIDGEPLESRLSLNNPRRQWIGNRP
jgi:hypothetical protein